MTCRVVWANLNPEADARGSWDQGIVEELTAGYEHVEWKIEDVFGLINEGAVFVVPGQHNRWSDMAELLAAFVQTLPWALTIITSDEEALFPVELLPHDDKHLIWGEYHARPEFDRVIPIGLPPNTETSIKGSRLRAWMNDRDEGRDLDVFFAGQNTHPRREELIDTMKAMACEPGSGNISWVASTGFRAGLERNDYLACMARTKIAPCPSGYHSLDSFRLYEAIAAGALPIIECSTPDAYEPEFWRALYGPRNGSWGTFPIPWVETWEDMPELVKIYRDRETWQHQRDKVQRWYADYRASLAADFSSTIARLQP